MFCCLLIIFKTDVFKKLNSLDPDQVRQKFKSDMDLYVLVMSFAFCLKYLQIVWTKIKF